MGNGSINTSPVTKWLFVANRKEESGLIISKEFEINETTLSDVDFILEVAPAIVQNVFVNTRKYTVEDVELYKIIRCPIGITVEELVEEDDDDDGGQKVRSSGQVS